ncbi:hypothetical protein H2198_006944 [Neophaeococcomyces mojaviensis]|uniref:Uncharacterized protein n=1 Tax=Neophaeococcomyces mojaviensis TaxID=3383035 RepID=A0ACC3A1X4_9EURO|nr:hypothetical protein H2198_006944 [Knufia sp. JES_112]
MEEPNSEYDEIPFGLKWRMHFGKPEQDPHTGMDILRLSNNRLVQTHCESTEYQALKLIDRHTSIPAYKVIGVYNRPEGKVVEYEGIPGKTLESCWAELNEEKKRRIISDLGRFVEQLRKMTPPPRGVVGDSTLGAALDTRFGPGKVGPFYSIDAFHDFMRRGHSPKEFRGDCVAKVHEERHKGSKPYVLKFTHANLVPSNILIDEAGRVCALIGWESSGWFPEYWEYVQMCSSMQSLHMEEWLNMMKAVVPRYDDELRCDQAIRVRFRSEDYERPRSVRPPSPTASMIALEQQDIDDKNTENTSG